MKKLFEITTVDEKGTHTEARFAEDESDFTVKEGATVKLVKEFHKDVKPEDHPHLKYGKKDGGHHGI